VTAALSRVDQLRDRTGPAGGAAIRQLTMLATQLERDASEATVREAARLRALATTLRGRAASFQ
jgi:hypothetical protein